MIWYYVSSLSKGELVINVMEKKVARKILGCYLVGDRSIRIATWVEEQCISLLAAYEFEYTIFTTAKQKISILERKHTKIHVTGFELLHGFCFLYGLICTKITLDYL